MTAENCERSGATHYATRVAVPGVYPYALIVALVVAFYPRWLLAQEYPTRPVRVVVPNAPGSLNDSSVRIVFSRVSEILRQQFIVDNRAGAGGVVGAELVAKSPRDGYTLLVSANTILVVNPFLYSKLAYDPLRDFE